MVSILVGFLTDLSCYGPTSTGYRQLPSSQSFTPDITITFINHTFDPFLPGGILFWLLAILFYSIKARDVIAMVKNSERAYV